MHEQPDHPDNQEILNQLSDMRDWLEDRYFPGAAWSPDEASTPATSAHRRTVLYAIVGAAAGLAACIVLTFVFSKATDGPSPDTPGSYVRSTVAASRMSPSKVFSLDVPTWSMPNIAISIKLDSVVVESHKEASLTFRMPNVSDANSTERFVFNPPSLSLTSITPH